MIPLAYGTYGMPGIAPADAIRHVADAGYDAVELTLATSHAGTDPNLPADAARAIRAALDETGLPLIAVLTRMQVLGSADEHRANLRMLTDLIASARAIGASSPTVVTFTMGGKSGEWPARRGELVERLGELGAIALAKGALLAVEPHAGGLVDSPERALDILDGLDPRAVRLTFDISHFALPGRPVDIDGVTARLLAHTAHIQIKDSVATSDGFRFVPPGEGPFDLVAWFRALAAGGWSKPVTTEVSAMVWREPAYDPIATLRSSFAALDRARRLAFAPSAMEPSR